MINDIKHSLSSDLLLYARFVNIEVFRKDLQKAISLVEIHINDDVNITRHPLMARLPDNIQAD